MSQLTDEQRAAQARADAMGREYVTRIDGRLAIILRPGNDEEEAARLLRVLKAIEGIRGS